MSRRPFLAYWVLACLFAPRAEPRNCPNGVAVHDIKCEHIVRYSDTSLTIGTIKLPIPLEVGGVTVDPKVVQYASVAAQILDIWQYSTCQNINAADCDLPLRSNLILKRQDYTYCLTGLALGLSSTTSSDQALTFLRSWEGDCAVKAQRRVEQIEPAYKGPPLETWGAKLRDARAEAVRSDPPLERYLDEEKPLDIKKFIK